MEGLPSAGARRQATTLEPRSACCRRSNPAHCCTWLGLVAEAGCLSSSMDARAHEQRYDKYMHMHPATRTAAVVAHALPHHITSHHTNTTPRHTVLQASIVLPSTRRTLPALLLSSTHLSTARSKLSLPSTTTDARRAAFHRPACLARPSLRGPCPAPSTVPVPVAATTSRPPLPGIHRSSHQSATAALLSRLTSTSSLLGDWVRLSAGPSWTIPTANVRAPAWGRAPVEGAAYRWTLSARPSSQRAMA